MLRLLEETAREPLQRRGQRLLETGREADLPPEVQRRVRAAIDARQPAKGVRVRRGRVRPRTLAFAAVLLLFSATGALAALGNDWIDRVVIQPVVSIIKHGGRRAPPPARASVDDARTGEQRVAPSDAPSTSGTATEVSLRPGAAPLAAAPTPGGEPTAAPAPVPARSAATANLPSRRRARAESLRASNLKAQKDSGLVFGAMVALRRDHDAARAGTLLDRYLAHATGGPLREEALALAVEAAVARHDSAARDRWSRAYLRSYPDGRFNQFVRATARN